MRMGGTAGGNDWCWAMVKGDAKPRNSSVASSRRCSRLIAPQADGVAKLTTCLDLVFARDISSLSVTLSVTLFEGPVRGLSP